MSNRNTIALAVLFLANIATLLVVNSNRNQTDEQISIQNANNFDLQNPTLGEVTLFAGTFAPRGWAFCHGQLLSISQNSALFSILGTTYGGDGETTFGLPDLRGRVAIGAGNGPGLNSSLLGQKKGQETRTLTTQNLPSHNHTASGALLLGDGLATTELGNDKILSVNTGTSPIYTDNVNTTTKTRSQSVEVTTDNAGGQQSFDIYQPSLGLNYIIAVQGTFPSN